jgi:G3E family GTPase
MIIHLLSGFLGSGKTTTIRHACRELIAQGKNLGVITNDQGTNIVDSRLFAYMQVPQKQVGNGCFCCNYDELDNKLRELTDTFNPDIIFAESVGTCTDIVATVMKPLIQYNAAVVTISTIADARLLHTITIENKNVFGEDVEYIFFKQLEEAEIIVVNKTDLLKDEEFMALQEHMSRFYSSKKIIYQNALAEHGVNAWLNVLDTRLIKRDPLRSLEIDYDKYAAGEAMLAYYDGELEIETKNGDAEKIAYELWNEVVGAISDGALTIGHLKCWLNERIKISFTSTTSEHPQIDFVPGGKARLLINARVQTKPAVLENVILSGIARVSMKNNCSIIPVEKSSFSPGYPRPVHRITM